MLSFVGSTGKPVIPVGPIVSLERVFLGWHLQLNLWTLGKLGHSLQCGGSHSGLGKSQNLMSHEREGILLPLNRPETRDGSLYSFDLSTLFYRPCTANPITYEPVSCTNTLSLHIYMIQDDMYIRDVYMTARLSHCITLHHSLICLCSCVCIHRALCTHI